LSAHQTFGGTVSGTSAAAYQQEAVVSGSIVSGGNFTTRIQWDSTSESRGVYEFALPTLPNGGSYTSVAINYQVAETNQNTTPPVASQLRFFPFAGNGRYDATDANTGGTGTLSPQFFSTGAYSTSLPVTEANAVNTVKGSWLGLMAWQEQFGYRTGVARGPGGGGGPAPTLSYAATVPDVGTLSTRAMVDAQYTNGVVTDGDTDIFTQSSSNTRGILEFNLGGLPDGATITSAALKFDVNLYTSDTSTGGPEPRVFGYNGNGAASAADGTAGSLIATGNEVTGLDAYTINLNPATVAGLMGSNDIVGFAILPSLDGKQFGFYTSESTFAGSVPVTLDVTYAVPEPTSLGAILLAGAGLLARRRAANRR
jgi:hypothetical protein